MLEELGWGGGEGGGGGARGRSVNSQSISKPLELMYLVFTRMPGESYRRRLRSLLLCPVTYLECSELPLFLLLLFFKTTMTTTTPSPPPTTKHDFY